MHVKVCSVQETFFEKPKILVTIKTIWHGLKLIHLNFWRLTHFTSICQTQRSTNSMLIFLADDQKMMEEVEKRKKFDQIRISWRDGAVPVPRRQRWRHELCRVSKQRSEAPSCFNSKRLNHNWHTAVRRNAATVPHVPYRSGRGAASRSWVRDRQR